MMERLGKTIKDRRNQLGVTQQELSDLALVGINTLVAVERGEGNPSLKTLLRITEVLGLELSLQLKQFNP